MHALLLLVLAGPPVPARAPNPHLESAAWVMDATVEGKLKLDQPATLQVQVVARAGFHINEEYPNNFKTDNGGDFERTKANVGDGITLSPCADDASKKCTATVRLKFTPRGSGSMLLGGIFALGTCDKDHCLIDKIPVMVQVDVAP